MFFRGLGLTGASDVAPELKILLPNRMNEEKQKEILWVIVFPVKDYLWERRSLKILLCSLYLTTSYEKAYNFPTAGSPPLANPSKIVSFSI